MKNSPISNLKISIPDQISKKAELNLDKSLSLEEVAEEFESLFVFQMLKSARKAKLAEGVFDSDAAETYQNLLDQEYSKTLAKNQNFGIAEALIRQFGKKEKIE